jgi:high-affinity iron transporter
MIKHKDSIVGDIQEKVKVSFTKKAIISLAAIMVAREGAEIVLFVFASAEPLSYGTGALFGVLLSSVVTFLIYKSLIKVNLKVIFSITLFYLILQAGFMLGYSVHELFSYFKAEGILESTHWYYTKLFDLSGTFLDHKEAPLGILLYASIGYYSKPEVLQFVIQYVYTISILVFYFRNR